MKTTSISRIQKTGNNDIMFVPVNSNAFIKLSNVYPKVTIFKYNPKSGDCFAYGVSEYLMTLPLHMFN